MSYNLSDLGTWIIHASPLGHTWQNFIYHQNWTYGMSPNSSIILGFKNYCQAASFLFLMQRILLHIKLPLKKCFELSWKCFVICTEKRVHRT